MPTIHFAWSDLIPLLGALFAGIVVAGWWQRGRLQALYQQNASLQRELAGAQTAGDHLRERLDEANAHADRADTRLHEQAERLRELDTQYTQLQAVHTEKLAHAKHLQAMFEESRATLTAEFQNLANRILDEKGKTFATTSQVALDAMLRPFREQIDAFQKRVNQVHDETLRGNVSLGTEIRRIADMGIQIGHEASTLASALRGDKKKIGNWGEMQLERSLQLSGLVRGDHYAAQPPHTDAAGLRRHPDFVVYLPDDKHIVIDSKVSLVDYDKAVAAQETDEQNAALDAHVRTVRQHIDDLSAKDYSTLNGMNSPSFVLMFMPVEAACMAALQHSPDLYEYGCRKNVVLVSHTTLMPVLKTIANIWLMVRSNEQAHQLSEQAGDIYNQVAIMAERLKRLGATLGTVSRHYNDTVTAVAGQQGLFGKVSRFADLSARANRELPSLDTLVADFHEERLTVLNDGSQPAHSEALFPDGAARSSKQ